MRTIAGASQWSLRNPAAPLMGCLGAAHKAGTAWQMALSTPCLCAPVMNAVCSAVHLQVHYSCSCQGLLQDVVLYGLLQLSQKGLRCVWLLVTGCHDVGPGRCGKTVTLWCAVAGS